MEAMGMTMANFVVPVGVSARMSSKVLDGKGRGMMVVKMSSRSKNRKPLQRGRNLSIEAIQAVQALKRANNETVIDKVIDSNFRRLLKFDMMAVLRELLRQNQCSLALKVFDDIRKEHWYKPKVSLYADMMSAMAANELLEKIEFLYFEMKAEKSLEADIEGFNSMLVILMIQKLTELAMDCYNLMKTIGCDPDRSSFRILITGFESMGETGLSDIVKQDARMFYGESLDFLNDEEEISTGCS